MAGYNDDRRLAAEQILKTGLAPRVPGIVVSPPIGNYSKGPVAVVHVPRSFIGPHMVAFQNEESRFWARHSNGKYSMDVDEIREAFNLSQSLTERILAFRTERVREIASERGIGDRSATAVLHLLPVSSFDRRTAVDVACEALIRFEPPLVPDPGLFEEGPTDSRFNLNGLLLTRYIAGPTQGGRPYRRKAGSTQFYRDGVVEIIANIQGQDTPQSQLPIDFGKRLACSFWQHLQVLKSVNVQPPLVVALSLLGCSAWKLHPSGSDESVKGQRQPFDHDPMMLPEAYLDSFDGPSLHLTRPVLDALWQAGGWERWFGEADVRYPGE